MWLAIRLLISIAVIFRRQIRAWFPRTPAGRIGGQPYFQVLQYKSKTKIITDFAIGIHLPTSVRFHFKTENELDRFFTRVGLSEEFQTGDAAFDQKVYIACDHPAMHRMLQQDQRLRDLLVAAFGRGFSKIHSDGSLLWIGRSSASEPTGEDLSLLGDLHSAFSRLAKAPGNVVDPFIARVILIETLIWSIAAYAVGALLEPLFHTFAHVDMMHLLTLGLLTGAGIMLGIGTVIFWLLRGSSQGHRVILESGIILALSLPIAGPMLVSDLNRHWDRTTPELVTRKITGKTISKGSGKRKSTSYYLVCEGSGSIPGIPLPERMRVNSQLYYQARTEGSLLEAQVHRGALGLAWYDGLSVRQEE
jgi:hypothetical protein